MGRECLPTDIKGNLEIIMSFQSVFIVMALVLMLSICIWSLTLPTRKTKDELYGDELDDYLEAEARELQKRLQTRRAGTVSRRSTGISSDHDSNFLMGVAVGHTFSGSGGSSYGCSSDSGSYSDSGSSGCD